MNPTVLAILKSLVEALPYAVEEIIAAIKSACAATGDDPIPYVTAITADTHAAVDAQIDHAVDDAFGGKAGA